MSDDDSLPFILGVGAVAQLTQERSRAKSKPIEGFVRKVGKKINSDRVNTRTRATTVKKK